eukprot:CAMPEP_0181213176 /NCGR_PEP_ID=MMETSP1096-20121128/24758_1 /TAXON_ID=156174 ORGANISM="Chrysochromulina ericina, Strain CCMP281" /NCGR_SAMPLE_ID=MMETSP1096 /ASSEMBLY_ACC=CAM_ASM_000453 /LENGTH=115 /DNA_ID=CAMNT_0023304783 /DNA_START=214 /DNA_END=558 /DNA_ORIENTATION=+
MHLHSALCNINPPLVSSAVVFEQFDTLLGLSARAPHAFWGGNAVSGGVSSGGVSSAGAAAGTRSPRRLQGNGSTPHLARSPHRSSTMVSTTAPAAMATRMMWMAPSAFVLLAPPL